MAFQFKRDRSQNIELILAGDIDLEVTPDIKAQLVSQLEDANSLLIDGKNISYLDSSGVSILVISMQNCKQKQLAFKIPQLSEEAFRVLQLAKLDKILPIENVSGPAQLVDVDAFSGVSGADGTLAHELSGAAGGKGAPMAGSSDDDLIAALASGDMGSHGDDGGADNVEEPAPEPKPEPTPEAAEEISLEMTPAPAEPTPTEPVPQASPAPAPASDKSGNDGSGGNDGGGGNFTPGTFS